jgi:tRNA(Ile)-lysidine synthase
MSKDFLRDKSYNESMDMAKFPHILTEKCQLGINSQVVVGVSGGPDSLTLLDLLTRLHYPIVVAHYDHSLRPESHQEALFVQDLAGQRGLPFSLGRGDVNQMAHEQKLSIEEACRIARYHFLFQTAREYGAQCVAVAHTADDQVETVLMHLIRGAGLAGLKGMPYRAVLPEWDDQIPLVRPLLGMWREEILSYCEENRLEPVFDATNQNSIFFRNRLRNDLLPYLENYNSRIKEVVWRMAQNLGGDYELIEALTIEKWQDIFINEDQSYIIVSFNGIRTLPVGLQRNLLRHMIAKLRPALRNIDFNDLERALAFIQNPTKTSQTDLVSGVWLYLKGDHLILSEQGAFWNEEILPVLPVGEWGLLPVPGEVKLTRDWQIRAEFAVQKNLDEIEKSQNEYEAWIDADSIDLPLKIRTRLPGDRFRPLGMGGHSLKLSDFFINIGLTRNIRDQIPLVCNGNDIAWIPGLRLSEKCRVRETTSRVIHLFLFGPDFAV